ncbi:NAD(P)-binding protein [Pluteus cervinus]|uniref:NAD(P)-binding protein n=1 Tax=Pluteus cervinus TaxID=181527 RepID=A0ACD3B5P8_9AGAR|nr:NAD(P)-binding protein [Pluteus cervinus]
MFAVRALQPQHHRTGSGHKLIPSHGRLTIQTHILLTGGTGYIGGSVLTRLLSHPHSDAFQIVVLVRSPEKAHQFRKMGIKAVIGDLGNSSLLRELAGAVDVVFSCADADNLGSVKAILSGLKDHYERTGVVASLIHTSGTGVLMDDAQGMYASPTIYSDMDVPQLESLPSSQPHREVDLEIVNADKQGFVKTYIVLPGTIYGRASGPLVDLHVQNPRSQQLPRLLEVSLDRGQGGMVGVGKNVWPCVHIDDVADLYFTIFNSILSEGSSKQPGHGRSGFYFAENGEYTMYDLAKAVSSVLYQLGKGKDPKPTTFTEAEMEKYFPSGTSLGTNSRCKGERATGLGWKPEYRTKDLLESVRGEVDDTGEDNSSSSGE